MAALSSSVTGFWHHKWTVAFSKLEFQKGCGGILESDWLLEYQLGAPLCARWPAMWRSGPRNYRCDEYMLMQHPLEPHSRQGSPGVRSALSDRVVPSRCHDITEEKWVSIWGSAQVISACTLLMRFSAHFCWNVRWFIFKEGKVFEVTLHEKPPNQCLKRCQWQL